MAGTALQEIRHDVIQKEKDKWVDEGEIKATQKHIIATLTERFDVVGASLAEKIKSITSLPIKYGHSRQ